MKDMKKIYLKPEIIVSPVVMEGNLLVGTTPVATAEFCNFGTRQTHSWFNEGYMVMEKEPGLSIGLDNGNIDSRSKGGSIWDE